MISNKDDLSTFKNILTKYKIICEKKYDGKCSNLPSDYNKTALTV
jgi:hypothetical protein